MFTGSTRVGREVAKRVPASGSSAARSSSAARTPLVVRADADIERSAEITERACFANAGQLCIGTERILVHESVAEEFLAAAPRAGGGACASRRASAGARTWDRWSRQRQLDQRARPTSRTRSAKGAEVLTGGEARPDVGPFYFAPTLLRGVTPR